VNLDQIGKEAGRDARQSAHAMPVVPIDRLRRRRLLFTVTPLAAAGVATVAMAVVFLVPASDPNPPAASVPTPTTIPAVTTTTAPPPTTMPAEVVLPDAEWVRGTVDQIIDDQGQVLFEFPSTILYGRNTAWDGDDGFVALTDGEFIWMRPNGRETIDAPFGTILDAAKTDGGTHVVGIETAEDHTIHWFELESGNEVPAPSQAKTLDGDTFTVGNRSATIEDPDWSDVERDETGAPVPPFDLPDLVVTEDDEEILRMPVGSQQRPYVDIHDFDGRRLIFGAQPLEPAVPPTTVWIVDLECSDCTEKIETPSLEYFDLIGVLPTQGDVIEPAMP
jgi:hypothetical protein